MISTDTGIDSDMRLFNPICEFSERISAVVHCCGYYAKSLLYGYFYRGPLLPVRKGNGATERKCRIQLRYTIEQFYGVLPIRS